MQGLTAAAVALVVLAGVCFVRLALGPSAADRIIALNVIGTKTVAILCLVGYTHQETGLFVDVALVYALISFLASVGLARYLTRGNLC